MSRKNYFKGKSIEDILNIDYGAFKSLSERELRQAVSRLSSAANKRIQRLEKSKLLTPSLIEVRESGGKFGTKNKSTSMLQAEFFRAKMFLKSGSSTVKEAKFISESARKQIENVYDIKFDNEQYNKLLQAFYDGFLEDREYQAQRMRYAVLYKQFGIDPKKDTDDRIEEVKKITELMVNELSRRIKPGDVYDGFADFFKLE